MTRKNLFPLFLLTLIVLGIPAPAPVYANDAGDIALQQPVDVTPPDIAWMTTGGDVSGVVDLTVFVKDTDSLPAAVELSFDDGKTWERHQFAFFEGMAAPDNWKELAQEATWTLHGFDTRQFPNGPLTILARAHDQAGNVTPDAWLTLLVENQ